MMSLAVTAAILAPAPLQARDKDSQTYTEVTTVEGMQVSVGKCLNVAERGDNDNKALLAALMGSLVSKGVNLLGQAFTKAGAEKTWSATASRNFEPRADWFPHCLQIARGKFSTQSMAPGSWQIATWPTDTSARLAANGMTLLQAPEFLFEAEIVQSSTDASVLTVRPVKVSFGRPIGTRALRGESREIAVFAAISTPGTKAALSTNPAATLILGPMAPGTTRTYLDKIDLPYVRTPYESTWFTIAKADLLKPLTLTAMVSETQGADKFLTFIGSVLGDKPVQDALIDAGSTYFVPGYAANQANLAANADGNTRAAAMEKFAIAFGKVSACAAGSKPVEEGSAAYKALNDYVVADRALKPPSGLVDDQMIKTIDVTKPGTVAVACKAILEKISPA